MGIVNVVFHLLETHDVSIKVSKVFIQQLLSIIPVDIIFRYVFKHLRPDVMLVQNVIGAHRKRIAIAVRLLNIYPTPMLSDSVEISTPIQQPNWPNYTGP